MPPTLRTLLPLAGSNRRLAAILVASPGGLMATFLLATGLAANNLSTTLLPVVLAPALLGMAVAVVVHLRTRRLHRNARDRIVAGIVATYDLTLPAAALPVWPQDPRTIALPDGRAIVATFTNRTSPITLTEASSAPGPAART
jgi:hypothetical protein